MLRSRRGRRIAARVRRLAWRTIRILFIVFAAACPMPPPPPPPEPPTIALASDAPGGPANLREE